MSEDEMEFFIDSLRGGRQTLRVEVLHERHKKHGIRQLERAIGRLKGAAVRRGIPIYVGTPKGRRAQSGVIVVSVWVELIREPAGLRRGCFGEE